jgi:hypothetical protein
LGEKNKNKAPNGNQNEARQPKLKVCKIELIGLGRLELEAVA